MYIYTSSAAQCGGGSFRIENLSESLVVVNHGWHSESTDGLKRGWVVLFWSGYNGCSGHLVGHLCVLCVLSLEMCIARQRRAILHFSSDQMSQHPPL